MAHINKSISLEWMAMRQQVGAYVCGTRDRRQDLLIHAELIGVVVQFWRVVHQGLRGAHSGESLHPWVLMKFHVRGSVKVV